MKKILSISLWGNNPAHLSGIREKIKALPKMLPGWGIRVYYDDTVDLSFVTEIAESCDVIRCPRCEGYSGLFWRYRPFYDYTLERFFVIDAEVNLTKERAGRIMQWEKSGVKFYIARLHSENCVPIMGGYFGSVPGILPDAESVMEDFMKYRKPKHPSVHGWYYGMDQIFLIENVWPLVMKAHIAHVAKGCPHLKLSGSEIEV